MLLCPIREFVNLDLPPEPPGGVSRGGSASKVDEITGRVVKNRGLGTLHRISRIPSDPGIVVAATAARTPPSTRAGGEDDGSYTNSLKIYNII